jgi:hypothetical protein
VKQRALFERKKKEEEYFVSEKLLKNTTPHTKEEKKRLRLRFTYRLKTLHSHFSHLQFLHMHFCGGDSIAIMISSSNRSMMMRVLFLD